MNAKDGLREHTRVRPREGEANMHGCKTGQRGTGTTSKSEVQKQSKQVHCLCLFPGRLQAPEVVAAVDAAKGAWPLSGDEACERRPLKTENMVQPQSGRLGIRASMTNSPAMIGVVEDGRPARRSGRLSRGHLRGMPSPNRASHRVAGEVRLGDSAPMIGRKQRPRPPQICALDARSQSGVESPWLP